MESNYRNRDFEQFVTQNADQYRMFPSEKVWKNVHSALHTRRKWYGAGLAFLLLVTASAVTWVMVTNPVSEKQKNSSSGNLAIAKKTVSQLQPVSDANNNIPGFSNQFNGFIQQSSNEDATEKTFRSPLEIPETPDHLDLNNLLVPSINQSTIFKSQETGTPAFSIGRNNFPDISAMPEDIGSSETRPAEITISQNRNEYPLSLESVTNAYQPRNLGKKINWQFFITPTISYRQLTANSSVDNNALVYPYSSLGSVNNAVTHRPDLGLQIGISAGYPVTKNLKLRGGLQFNVNRYDIKAFAYNPEIATINLNDATGSSISTWTSYRNYGGYRTNWLKNFYFSVSAPIGIELKLLGNEKTSWGIAGSIQPTYILKDKAYLISTDYKNYTKVPWLVRRVNLSTSFETFVNLGSKTKWQIGPQVRYQLLSSFQNKYPVKEHLFDFGLKVGVFLNK